MSRTALDRTALRVTAVSAAALGVGASLGFIPGFLATALREDLGISRGEVGLIVGIYFGSTGIGSILGGRLTARIGARTAVVWDMLLVAGAGTFVALIGSYWAWLVASVLAGSGYALVNAGTNVAVAQVVPANRRILAMSIKTAGVPVMAVIASGVGPYAADRWSWQALIWVTVAISLIVAGASARVLESHRPTPSRQPTSTSLPKGFVWFAVSAFMMIAGSQPLYSWTVAYIEQGLDASPGQAGSVVAIASGVGVWVMIVNGARSDGISPSQRMHRMRILVMLNAAATGLVLAGLVAGIVVVLIGAVIGISTQLAAIGMMHAAIVDRAPDAVARATGVTMTGYYLGALIAPTAFGALVDVTGTFAWSWLAVIVVLSLSVPSWRIAERAVVPRNVMAEPDHISSTHTTGEHT